MTWSSEQLVKARAAQRNAYAPYSRFSVGAALRRTVRYTVDAISRTHHILATICAEGVLKYKAVSEGQTAFAAMAVTCDSPALCACGCLQAGMMEFAPGDACPHGW